MALELNGAIFVLDFSSPVIENAAYSKRDPGWDYPCGRVCRITCPANPLLQSLGIMGRPSRVLRYWQDQIDGAINWLAQLEEDEQIRVRTEAVLACGFSPSGRTPQVALQVARFPMHGGTQRALDDTMDFFGRSGPIRP